jgi:hypothetical protein
VIQQVAEQVGFWNANVSVRHAAGTKKNADRGSTLSVAAAEKETDIKQQQVSRWRKALPRSHEPRHGSAMEWRKSENIRKCATRLSPAFRRRKLSWIRNRQTSADQFTDRTADARRTPLMLPLPPVDLVVQLRR